MSSTEKPSDERKQQQEANPSLSSVAPSQTPQGPPGSTKPHRTPREKDAELRQAGMIPSRDKIDLTSRIKRPTGHGGPEHRTGAPNVHGRRQGIAHKTEDDDSDGGDYPRYDPRKIVL